MFTNIDPYAIPPLSSAIGNLLLGGLVLWKNPRSQLHKAWALFSLCCAIWNFGFFMVYVNEFNKQAALFWNHFYSVGMVMIPTAYLYYILVLTESKKKWLWAAWWGTFSIAVLITPTITTDLFNKDLIMLYWGFSPLRGIVGSVYDITYPIVVLIGIYILIANLRESYGRKKLQIKFGILASLLGFSLGLTNFFPLYGINIYPLGPVGNLLANATIAYSIMRYTFMDIDIIIKKGLVYSMMTGSLAGLYVSIIFVGQETIGLVNPGETFRILITVAAVVLVAVAFEPLRSVIQKFVDARFFKTRYDYQEAIKEFSRMVVTILDLDQLLHKTAETIRRTLQLDQVVVFLKNTDTKDFEVAAFTGADESVVAKWSYTEESGLVQRLSTAKRNVILDSSPDAGQAIMSLTIDNEIRGFLVLGEKLSGDVYTPNDLDLLSTLADQLSIAVENSSLYRAAVTNKLTKLFNGSYFYRRLDEELVRSQKQQQPIAVLLIDVDGLANFSRDSNLTTVNQVLVSIGQIIKDNCRVFDVAARVGDDEFALILPGIESMRASIVAQKIIDRIAICGREDGTSISASIGIGYSLGGIGAAHEVMNQARISLLERKENGRAEGLTKGAVV